MKRLGSIPALPAVLARGIPLLVGERALARDAVRFVATDPALTTRILRVINTPLYGPRYKVSSPSQALTMLGPSALGRIARGVQVLPEDAETTDDWIRLWRHGLATGLAAHRIAVKVGYDLPDVAFTAGVVHDIGLYVLLLYAPPVLRRARARAISGPESVVTAEAEILGVDHTILGAMIAERWNFPRLLRDVIRHHHDTAADLPGAFDGKCRELCEIVSAADALSSAAGFGADGTGESSLETLVVGELVELRAAEVDLIRTEVTRELALSPAGNAASGAGDPRPDLAPEAPLELSERLAELGELLAELRAMDDPDEILPRALVGLHGRLGFDRVLYLESAAGGCRLSGREFHDGTSVTVDMRDLDFELSTHPGLERVLTPGASGLLRAESDPDPVLTLMGVRELVAASLTMHGSIDGVLIADAFFSDRELLDVDAALLRVFALSVGSIIENRGLTRQTRHLRRLAEKDDLMGINNRRSLMQRLEKEVVRARATSRPLSVAMMDVDHFKRWNDRYGHQAGDGILRDLAKVVQETSRDSDVVGRYGGEEFMAVLRDTTRDAAVVYAERLRGAVRELDRRVHETYPDVPLTLSIGVTELREDESIQMLIRRVDRALYAAKRQGRDRVCVGA